MSDRFEFKFRPKRSDSGRNKLRTAETAVGFRLSEVIPYLGERGAAFGGLQGVELENGFYPYGTFAMFPDLGYIKWFNTLPGRVRWIGYAPKPLETCLVRPGAGASSPETVMRFHSNRRHHESSQARLDQAHAPPTTPRRTKATSPMTLRLRWGGKDVEKGVGRPQVVGGKSSGGV